MNQDEVNALRSAKTFIVSPRQNAILLNGTKKSHVAVNFPFSPLVSNESYECKLRPLYAIIPNIFKNIPTTQFLFTSDSHALGFDDNGEFSFTFYSGFYTIRELINSLNNTLKKAMNPTNSPNIAYLQLKYDFNQNRCSTVWINVQYRQYVVIIYPNAIWQRLGFEFTHPVNSYLQEASLSPNLSAIDHIYIHSPSLAGNTYSSELNGDFIAFIPMDTPYGTTSQHQFQNNFFCMFPATQLSQKIVLEFTDGDGTLIDFDNLDWTVAFEITFVQTQADTTSDFYKIISDLHLLRDEKGLKTEEKTQLIQSEILNPEPGQIPYYDLSNILPANALPEPE